MLWPDHSSEVMFLVMQSVKVISPTSGVWRVVDKKSRGKLIKLSWSVVQRLDPRVPFEFIWINNIEKKFHFNNAIQFVDTHSRHSNVMYTGDRYHITFFKQVICSVSRFVIYIFCLYVFLTLFSLPVSKPIIFTCFYFHSNAETSFIRSFYIIVFFSGTDWCGWKKI